MGGQVLPVPGLREVLAVPVVGQVAQGAAQGDVELLQPAADPQHRQPCPQRGGQHPQRELVAGRVRRGEPGVPP